jgi:UDP-N-acetylmuramoyl-L-alanyl-D-glutamate--2,6-diaminopimelate ligase
MIIQKLKNLYHLLQAVIFNILNGFPSKSLKVIGVTGTDGKTTTSSLIYHILKASDKKVALISTIAAYIGDDEIDIGLHVTTPDPWKMPGLLRRIKDANYELVVIEATSQGLVQNRLWGVDFSTAVFTNIGHDHLDYHGKWENYAKAKLILAKQLKSGGTLVINEDHLESIGLLKEQISKLKIQKKDIVTKFYSKMELSDIEQTVEGLSFIYQEVKFKIPAIGEYNLENALAAIDALKDYLSLEQIASGMATFAPPSGRMEVMQSKPFTVIVDFAHTPGALEKALSAVRSVREEGGRIICVFGCAGKRDKSRRKMGAVSVNLADITVLVPEDPRDETTEEVNDDIIKHALEAGGKLIERFRDSVEYRKHWDTVATRSGHNRKTIIAFDENNINSREDGIEFAINSAKEKDIVFITGKGHEKSLSFGAGEKEVPWSDREVVRKVLGNG